MEAFDNVGSAERDGQHFTCVRINLGFPIILGDEFDGALARFHIDTLKRAPFLHIKFWDITGNGKKRVHAKHRHSGAFDPAFTWRLNPGDFLFQHEQKSRTDDQPHLDHDEKRAPMMDFSQQDLQFHFGPPAYSALQYDIVVTHQFSLSSYPRAALFRFFSKLAKIALINTNLAIFYLLRQESCDRDMQNLWAEGQSNEKNIGSSRWRSNHICWLYGVRAIWRGGL